MAINDTPTRLKPLPRSRRSKYDGTTRFSQLPPKENRANQIKRSDDTFRNISIGLQDIDESIIYFFKNVIKPRVFENNKLIDVPVMYGSPEYWAHIKLYGYAKDQKGKIITPIVMYRRTNMSRDDSMPVDKLNRNLVHTFPKKYSNEHNKYDRFSLTNNMKPTYEMYSVVVPDYVVLTYECSIWSSYIEQMNKIVEGINYWEGHYWGDPDKFKFSTRIDSFDQNTDIDTDKGRLVRSDFTLEIRGFLIPEVANDQITTQKEYTKQQIILENETEVDVLSLSQTDPLAQRIVVTTNKQPAVTGNQTITDMVNTKFNQLLGGLQYVRKKKVYSTYTTVGSTIINQSDGTSVVTYPNVYTASVPSDITLTATNEEDFIVFVNGQYMEHDAYTIQQSGSDFVIIADTGSLGYDLGDDEIVTWGLFD